MSTLSSKMYTKLTLLLKWFLVTGIDTQSMTQNRAATKVNRSHYGFREPRTKHSISGFLF